MCHICDLGEFTRSVPPERVYQLALVALTGHLLGNTVLVAIIMDTASRSYGREGLYKIALTWCDFVLYKMSGYERGDPVYLVWEDTRTGRITHAHDTPPTIRWAGQMLAARAADDEVATRSLYLVVPDDEIAEYMTTLLQVLASQLRDRKQGDVA